MAFHFVASWLDEKTSRYALKEGRKARIIAAFFALPLATERKEKRRRRKDEPSASLQKQSTRYLF
jgi:hypothetical protein